MPVLLLPPLLLSSASVPELVPVSVLVVVSVVSGAVVLLLESVTVTSCVVLAVRVSAPVVGVVSVPVPLALMPEVLDVLVGSLALVSVVPVSAEALVVPVAVVPVVESPVSSPPPPPPHADETSTQPTMTPQNLPSMPAWSHAGGDAQAVRAALAHGVMFEIAFTSLIAWRGRSGLSCAPDRPAVRNDRTRTPAPAAGRTRTGGSPAVRCRWPATPRRDETRDRCAPASSPA